MNIPDDVAESIMGAHPDPWLEAFTASLDIRRMLDAVGVPIRAVNLNIGPDPLSRDAVEILALVGVRGGLSDADREKIRKAMGEPDNVGRRFDDGGWKWAGWRCEGASLQVDQWETR